MELRYYKKSAYIILLLSLLFMPTHAAYAVGGIIRDAEIESLLRDYANPLLKAAGLKPDNVKIGIINNRAINAFVTGGQNMYYNTGLILEAEHPNMVIGVIAHEIGHISGGHLSRNDEAMRSARAPMLIGTILGLGSILAGAGNVGIALLAGGQHIGITNYLSYSRGQEAAADQTAISLLEATQQSPQGIADLMGKLAEQEILNEVRQDPYVRSHPLSRNRVNAYMAGAKRSPYFDKKDSPEMQFRHDMAKAKIRGFLDHPRNTLRYYKDDNDSLTARYARAIAYHKLAEIDKSIALIDGLIAQAPDNPWFYELKGQVYYEAGFAGKAIAPYKQSIALRPDQPLLLIGLASAQIALVQDEKIEQGSENAYALLSNAIRILRVSTRLADADASAFLQLSKAYALLQDIGRADWALAEYYAAQANGQAIGYAKRALRKLPVDSAEYLRAQDIANSSQRAEGQPNRGRPGGGRRPR